MLVPGLQRLTAYELPSFSSLNGPANLAYLVQQLELMQVHPAAVRLIPYFGHGVDREILPYKETRPSNPRETCYESLWNRLRDPKQVGALQLLVNVRDDNRLKRYVALLTVGVLPDAQLRGDWERLLDYYEQERQRLVEQLAAPEREDTPDNQLPVTAQQCFELLIQHLVNRYPELADLEDPYDVTNNGVIIPKRWSSETQETSAEWRAWRRQTRTLREILEAFLTHVFLIIGCIDLIGGREYSLAVLSNERICALPLKPPISIQAVSDWLLAFPHHPPLRGHERAEDPEELPPPPRLVLRMPSFAPAEPRNGQSNSPNTDITRETLAEQRALWTTADPAVHQLTEALQRATAEKGEPLGTDEILTLVNRHVPDYIPTHPAQARLIGGWDLTVLLLRHIRKRWSTGTFLGVSEEDLQIFEPLERDFIDGLLILRRAFADPVYLYQMAARVTVGSDVVAQQEPYQSIGCELGSDRAALGVSLAVSALAQLHEPRIQVYLPLDSTQFPEQAAFAIRKLRILQKLFLPAHIPVSYQWAVDWAVLGETAYLASDGDAFLSGARLASPASAEVL